MALDDNNPSSHLIYCTILSPLNKLDVREVCGAHDTGKKKRKK